MEDMKKIYEEMYYRDTHKQTCVWVEELAELIQAISKHERYCNKKTREDMYEEIADVEIIIDQLITLKYLDTEKITRIKHKKENNLKKLINGG